ncbi:MAG: hypothetical protein HY420_03165 [Candidatus Kerfeldbacteria bacterium]|nr:hypothetical protein [Candidatus Kerfeldbacteria bacterium]
MKKLFITAFVLAAVFLVGPAARAAIVGELDQDNLNKALNKQDSTVNLFNLSSATLTDLATAVVSNDGMVTVKSNVAYFTNDQGFHKQAVGTITPATITSGAKLKLMAAQGNTMVVSNASGNSFLYYVAQGTKKSFTPKVKEITSASLTSNEKHLALVGQNAKGKKRLFIAHGTLPRLTELDLPPGAKSCSVIALSENGQTVYAGCTFSNKRGGYAVAVLDGVNIKGNSRKIDGQQVLEAAWLNKSKLVTMTQDSQSVVSMKELITSNGKVLNTKVIGKTLLVDENTVAFPMSFLRSSSNAILYNFIIVTTDGNPVGTTLGTYNTKTSDDQNIYSGTRFLFLMEATL